MMNRYEELQLKATECRIAAYMTEGFTRAMWIHKANQLEEMAGNLPVVKIINKE